MVHTAELTYFPSSDMIKQFKTAEGTVFLQQYKVWYNGSLRNNGLQFRLKYIGVKNFNTPRLFCRINFKKVISNSIEYKVDVLTAWEIDQVEYAFNSLIDSTFSFLPYFEDWWLNRIDYCVNIHTPYVTEYLNLLKKGDRPYLKDWYDHQGNYGQKEGSLYLVSKAKRKNRSITVNFYNKLDEMRKDLDDPTTEEEYWEYDKVMELAADVLRLEIQCHKPKTEHIKKKYGIPYKSIVFYLDPNIAYEIIKVYLLRICGTADYHRKPEALKLIDNCNFQSKTKEKMKKIITDVAKQHSSVAKVRDKYLQDGTMDRDEFSRLIKKMQDHNINPVTIRSNLHIDGKTLREGLPNLCVLYEDAFEAEMIVDAEE